LTIKSSVEYNNNNDYDDDNKLNMHRNQKKILNRVIQKQMWEDVKSK
jgi:hypothetical protein